MCTIHGESASNDTTLTGKKYEKYKLKQQNTIIFHLVLKSCGSHTYTGTVTIQRGRHKLG